MMTNRSYTASVKNRLTRSKLSWLAWALVIFGATAVLGLGMFMFGPYQAIIAWLFYLIGVFAILYQPRFGLYLILFFGLAGDGILTPWFPFTKNFSSRESLMFLHDALIISPMEGYILLVFLAWFGHSLFDRKRHIYRGALFWPAVAFLAFVGMGLAYGVATGGNLTIALWEARPLFYLVAMIILVSNLLITRGHAIRLIWMALLALFFEALIGALYVIFTLKGTLASVDAIAEHSASLHMNTLIILAVCVWLYRSSAALRTASLVVLPLVMIFILANQRRASFIGLGMGLLLIALILYQDYRRLFWYIIPPIAAVATVYIVLFWNSSGAIGMPVQAIKSVIAESQANLVDQSSNIYRTLENINIQFTINLNPLTGVGFGNKFYILVPMADISSFLWWEYFTHNSILWIWLKTGVGGFFAMLYLVGMAIMTGMRAFRRMPRDELRIIALVATIYFVMHFIYAYVDISWDTQSMIYVGAMMGVVSCLERIARLPISAEPRRWPWQEYTGWQPALMADSQEGSL